MNAEKALVLDLDASQRSLSSTLQRILAPYFELNVPELQTPLDDLDIRSLGTTLNSIIRQSQPDLIFLVLSESLLEKSQTLFDSIADWLANNSIIVVTETCPPDEIFELLKVGVADFIIAPFDESDVLPRAWRLIRRPDPDQKLTNTVKCDIGLKQLIGESPAFRAQIEKIPLIARCSANVLITGETGTGKELYARAIHYCSPRARGPFLPVNCGAIPTDLIENELFGHERGAYTSASTLQRGLIEEACGGTLFLDEIDCLPTLAQVKLLRFLQEKEYRPIGSTRARRADVRIIAASNLKLEEAVENGRMRQDLYYRLNIVSLHLCPLRERREDIPLLVAHFNRKYSREFHTKSLGLAPEALHLLLAHNWPGNVRELEHVIERAIVLGEEPTVRTADPASAAAPGCSHRESLREAKAREIALFEKNYVRGLLSACRGNITKAAQMAQKNRRAFWQLIHKYQIDVSSFKSGTS